MFATITDVIGTILFACLALFFFYTSSVALKTGRVLTKGRYILRKKEPFGYWSSVGVLALTGLSIAVFLVYEAQK